MPLDQSLDPIGDDRSLSVSAREMKPILFGHLVSPPVRAVMMLIRYLNLDVDVQKVDLFARENLKPEFIKMSPMHTVPVLKHGELLATDSHSILMYLVDLNAPGSSLFPTNLPQRTEVLNKLMFNASYFFPRDAALFRSIIQEQSRDYSGHKGKIEEAYGCLEVFLTQNKFMAGSNLTIADFAILTTATTLDYMFPITGDKWPKTWKWLETMKELPFYEEVNEKGLSELKQLLDKMLKRD